MLPGPSQLHRVAACVGSEVLPHAGSISRPASRGHIIHAFLAAVSAVGREQALLAVPPEDREACEAIPVQELPAFQPEAYAPEVSFAYDATKDTARETGRGLERDAARAAARDGEMPMTADVVGLTADAVVVYDYKTGWGHVDRPAVNWQVRTYALAAARAYGKEHAVVGIIRVLDGGTIWWDRAEMDALDLDAHAAELRQLLARRKLAILAHQEKQVLPKLVEGEHCRYCPALPYCPAKVKLLQEAIALRPDAPPDLEREVSAALTPETAASAWRKLEQAQKLIERLQAVVKDYARQHPVPLGDGYVLGEVTKARESIVAERAQEVLRQRFGDQIGGVVYSESVEVKTAVTKSALKSALNKYVLPTLPKPEAKITLLMRSVEDALRQRGAMSVASFKCVEEHKPKALAESNAPAEQPAA
jgi:CRISPR/Cas system-associated exonuclease Cas4 (RecB family)